MNDKPIIKSTKNQLQVDNSVIGLNDLLFEQLSQIKDLDVNDEKFTQKKEKVMCIAEVADRIIKNNEFMLKVKVWNSHQNFRLTSRGYDE